MIRGDSERRWRKRKATVRPIRIVSAREMKRNGGGGESVQNCSKDFRLGKCVTCWLADWLVGCKSDTLIATVFVRVYKDQYCRQAGGGGEIGRERLGRFSFFRLTLTVNFWRAMSLGPGSWSFKHVLGHGSLKLRLSGWKITDAVDQQ